MSVQTPGGAPQVVGLAAGQAPQTPLVHGAPETHVFPHAPQFSGSLETSMHAVPHVSFGEVHAHRPEVQTCPGLQTLPQAPQFDRSVAVSTHEPSQISFGAAHPVSMPVSIATSVPLSTGVPVSVASSIAVSSRPVVSSTAVSSAPVSSPPVSTTAVSSGVAVSGLLPVSPPPPSGAAPVSIATPSAVVSSEEPVSSPPLVSTVELPPQPTIATAIAAAPKLDIHQRFARMRGLHAGTFREKDGPPALGDRAKCVARRLLDLRTNEPANPSREQKTRGAPTVQPCAW